MKKMFLLCIGIIVLTVLFVLCKNINSKYLYDKNGVLDLIKANELPCEVMDIKVTERGYDYTIVFIELYVSEEDFLINNYFSDEQYELAPGITTDLVNYGIQKDLIDKFGVNYKDFIVEKKNSKEYRPYSIYWFKLTESLQNKSNVLIYTIIPNEITIDTK